MRAALPFLLSLAGLPACAATDGHEPPRGAVETYTFVVIRSGDPDPVPGRKEMDGLMTGHFENMQRMADEGELLLAGPFVEPRVESDLRGIFVIDEADVARGLAIASSDPPTQRGVFRLEAFPFTTAHPLRRALELNRAFDAEREADPNLPAEDYGVRAFVLLTARASDAALDALASPALAPRLMFVGRLGGERDGELLAGLVVDGPDEARARLTVAGGGVTWDVHPWWSTRALEGLLPVRDQR